MKYNEQVIEDLNKTVDDIASKIDSIEDRSAIFAFYIQIVDVVKKASEEELLEKLLKMVLAEGVIAHATIKEDERIKTTS